MDPVRPPGTSLIVGGDGLIGQALARRLRAGGTPVVATTRRPAADPGTVPLDLAADAAAAVPLPAGIGTAYLLAAMTSMQECEARPDLSERVNVAAPIAIARRLAAEGTRIVFVSTNLVLDGEIPFAPIDAPRRPQTLYAAQKARVEAALLEAGSPVAAVLRITKVAETLRPLLARWSADLAAGRTVRPFADLVCAPLRLAALVEALVRLGTMAGPGLHHFGADRDVAYPEIARRLAVARGLDPALVEPTTSVEAGVRLPAVPRHTTLDCGPTLALLGLPPERTDAALDGLFASMTGPPA